MYANKRVKVVAVAGDDLQDFPEVVGFHGVVDRDGLTEHNKQIGILNGWSYGGIGLDKLGYHYFEFVKVELEPYELGDNVVLGYN